jgi:outer membrane lipoprotein-sorting protein
MKLHAKAVLCFSLLILAVATVACEKEGGAERAGKQVDKALDSAKDKIHEATE